MDYHFGKNQGNVGYKSTPGTPILVNFGQPLGPKIGQNPAPTSWGIIRGPMWGNQSQNRLFPVDPADDEASQIPSPKNLAYALFFMWKLPRALCQLLG